MGLTTDEEIREILLDYSQYGNLDVAILRIKLLISESQVAALRRLESEIDGGRS